MKRTTSFLVLAISCILILILVKCEKVDDPPEIDENTIGATGGKIVVDSTESSLQGLSISFPPGAVTEDVQISITLSESSPDLSSDELDFISPVFELESSGDSTFNEMVSVTIPIQVDMNQVNLLPLALYYKEESSSWELLEIADIDSAANAITFLTDHFSMFTVAGMVFTQQMVFTNEIISHISATRSAISDEDHSKIDSEYDYFQNALSETEDKIIEMSNRQEACGNTWVCGYKPIDEWIFDEIGKSLVYATFENGFKLAGQIVAGTAIGAVSGILALAATPCMYCYLLNSTVSPEFWIHLIRYKTYSMMIKMIEGTDYYIEKSKYFTDPRDNKAYRIIEIGNQTWFAENLAFTSFEDDPEILEIKETSEWNRYESPAYCWPENNENYKEHYGALYNWYAVKTGKLCPDGWHVPSHQEWIELEMFIGMSASEAEKLVDIRGTEEGFKLMSTSGWYEDRNGTDDFGFNAIPGIFRGLDGQWYGTIDMISKWYTSTQASVPGHNISDSGFFRSISNSWGDGEEEFHGIYVGYDRWAGLSIRCIKDR